MLDLLSASQPFLRSLAPLPPAFFLPPRSEALHGMAPQVDILASDYLTRIKGKAMIRLMMSEQIDAECEQPDTECEQIDTECDGRRMSRLKGSR